jgi:hypothetical protein
MTPPTVEAHDFPISRALLAVAVVDCLAQLVGIGLLVLPDVIDPLWPWPTTPFNRAFLGAVYAGSLTGTLCLVLRPRWSPGRIVLPMMALFTTTVTLASIAETARFASAARATIWFLIYALSAGVTLWHLWRYRRQPPAPTATSLRPDIRAWLLASVAVAGASGMAMVLLGSTATGYWPWPVDDFHARIYGSGLLTLALGASLLVRVATRTELRTLGATQLVSGVTAIGGLLVVDRGLQRVDWAAPGTWIWFTLFAGLAIAGGRMLGVRTSG